MCVLTPTLAEEKKHIDVSGYFGCVEGNQGPRFYVQFQGDNKADLTLVDAGFMRGRKWPGGGNDEAWIPGCMNRGKPVWQSKSKRWKRIIEGKISGDGVVGCGTKCVREPPGYPSWKSGGSSHGVPYQTSKPTGCLKISLLNAASGLVPEAETTGIPDMTDAHQLAVYLRDNNKNSRLRLGRHRRYIPDQPLNEQFEPGMRYIFFDDVHCDAIRVHKDGKIDFFPTLKDDGCHVLSASNRYPRNCLNQSNRFYRKVFLSDKKTQTKRKRKRKRNSKRDRSSNSNTKKKMIM